ncbi:hypothetical protein HY572_01610 [Candidatus Micrarchaeota archaeon]|nr:hypothetical protein [Candidatus Micrarchaeota archaeon]
MELIQTKPVSIPESLDLLLKRQKDGELGYEQQNTLTHLEAVAKMDGKDAKAMEKELKAAVASISDAQLAALVSIVPKNADDVRQVLAQEKSEATEDDVKNILAILKAKK